MNGKIILATDGPNVSADSLEKAVKVAEQIGINEITVLNSVKAEKENTHWFSIQKRLQKELEEDLVKDAASLKQRLDTGKIRIKYYLTRSNLEQGISELQRQGDEPSLVIFNDSGKNDSSFISKGKRMQRRVHTRARELSEHRVSGIAATITLVAVAVGAYATIFNYLKSDEMLFGNAQVSGVLKLLVVVVMAVLVGAVASRLLEMAGLEHEEIVGGE